MRRALDLGSLCLLVSSFAAGCGSSSGSNQAAAGTGSAVAGAAGKASTASGGAGGAGGTTGIAIAGMSSTASGGSSDACVETKQEGKLTPLDLFIMLDISSSMQDPTSARANAPTKWVAVSNALKSFLSDPASSGLGVGIQYFPLLDPAVPASCTSDAQCGSFGPCFLKFCQAATAAFYPCSTANDCFSADGADLGPCTPLRFCYPLIQGELTLCHDNSECARTQSCQPLNQCANDRQYVCPMSGQACGTQGGVNLGTCTGPESGCVNGTSCNPSLYASPAAPIAALPGNLQTLTASIDAQMPSGDTPTSPALSGAIQAAKAWGLAHPDHSVVALLATDGQPTECIADPDADPSGIAGVRSVAAAGVSGTPSVSTFVIGVFGPADTEARMNLDQIAMAGGTNSAFLVDTSQDVTAQFLAALNQIRGSRLACEYAVPAAPAGQTLDYAKVNVDFTNAGSTERLSAVTDAATCGTGEGWYYDQNPGTGTPTKIMICPATCQRLEAAAQGSVQIALGCATVVR